MTRVKRIIVLCILGVVVIGIGLYCVPPLFLGENNGFTSAFNNHPARTLVDMESNNDGEKKVNYPCKMQSFRTVESVFYARFSVYNALSEKQLDQIADYMQMYATGECYNTSDPTWKHDVVKVSLAFYKGDTKELLYAFIWQDGKRRDLNEDEIYLSPTD
jgi:hypothetical protein